MARLKSSLILLSLLPVIVSCTKTEQRQMSTWYFNGEVISTNNVQLYEDKAGSSMFAREKDKENTMNMDKGFALSCGSTSFPSNSSYPLYNGPQSYNPSLLQLHISYQGRLYGLSKYNAANVLISAPNGKLRFELPEAWFTNVSDGQDSALVKGTFCEP